MKLKKVSTIDLHMSARSLTLLVSVRSFILEMIFSAEKNLANSWTAGLTTAKLVLNLSPPNYAIGQVLKHLEP